MIVPNHPERELDEDHILIQQRVRKLFVVMLNAGELDSMEVIEQTIGGVAIMLCMHPVCMDPRTARDVAHLAYEEALMPDIGTLDT